jgi:DNA-binding NarL/FixJ family response regulator
MKPIQLGIVEDDKLVKESLEEYLSMQPEIDIVLTAESVEEFLHYLPRVEQLDMMLLDINLPGMSGLEGIEVIKEKRPDTDIIILSALDDYDRIYKALCTGAISYLSKRTRLPMIKEAILTVFQGGSYMSPEIARKVIDHMAPRRREQPDILTARQNQIVQGLVDGLSYKMIAGEYDISVETVRDHIKKIYKKLQVNSKAEVIRKRMDGEI